ncbi:MAG TPA: hypothetical protein VK731_06720 [Candidatus Cybelea sp.]|nr:hypothetical protein [Candidatus Cybelea sp.]
MNVLDENLIAQQCVLLRAWRIPFRQIGQHLATQGTLDENLIPLLLRLPQPTFFTHDRDFFRVSLCHARYAVVYLEVSDEVAAEFIRRFLRHPSFDTTAKRLGIVAKVQISGVQYWKKGRPGLRSADWSE